MELEKPMFTGDRARVVEMAGNGTPGNSIAAVLGCEPSYVSQLLAEEEVAAAVAERRAAKAQQRAEHDSSIEAAERKALEKIHTLLDYETNLIRAAKVFQVLNGAKKATDYGAPTGAPAGATVTITLPQEAQMHFKLTADAQVIEVGGRSMVPMQSHQVAKQLRNLQAERLLQLENSSATGKQTRSLIDQL